MQSEIDALVVAILVAMTLVWCWRLVLRLIVVGLLVLIIFGLLNLLDMF
jgi:hypothetical protein